jgi:hypothetical protein
MTRQKDPNACIQALTEHETATIVGKAVQTLRNERHRRTGIPYIKRVRLFYDDLC